MQIIQADISTVQEWARLTHCLFGTHHTLEDTLEDCREFLQSKKEVGYLCKTDGRYVAFINISIRHDYVNGTDSSPVAFVEAIYVEEAYRRKGIARALVSIAENHARECGCTQLASDCLISNTTSEQFHKGCGFEEAERVICFVKNV